MIKVHYFSAQDIIDFNNNINNQNLINNIQDLIDVYNNDSCFLYTFLHENEEKYDKAVSRILHVVHNIKLNYTTINIKDKMLYNLLMEVLCYKKDSEPIKLCSRSVKTITVRNKVALVLAKADTYIIYHKLSGSLIDILNSQDIIDDVGLNNENIQHISYNDDRFIQAVLEYQKEECTNNMYCSKVTWILENLIKIAQR